MLGHKTSLGNFKKTEIILSIFSDHNTMRLEVNYKKKTSRNKNTWRLNNMLLNNQWITEEIKEEIKKYLETNENKNTTIQKSMGCRKSGSKKEVYSNRSLSQETRKISNLSLHLKELEKEEQTKHKVSRRKEIIKIRAERNE